jgi:hypothetical protein
MLALLGTSFVSAPIIPWLSPSVVAGVLLILTVSGFVLAMTLWARGTAVS